MLILQSFMNQSQFSCHESPIFVNKNIRVTYRLSRTIHMNVKRTSAAVYVLRHHFFDTFILSDTIRASSALMDEIVFVLKLIW